MKLTVFFLIALMIFAVGCAGKSSVENPHGPTDLPVSECKAVKIAKSVMPAAFADDKPIISYNGNISPHGAWVVLFGPGEIPFAELGWEGDAKAYYKKEQSERTLPEGIFGNVLIYVDADRGIIISRQLSNGIILGYPGMYANCK